MKKMILKIGIALTIAGVACIVIKGALPEYLDENGILHEAFFLLPIGFGSLFGGVILTAVSKFLKK